MLTTVAVFLIHSALCSEIAQAAPSHKAEQPFSLKGGRTIVVKRFEFSGNKAISTAQLDRLTKPYLNRTLSESNLLEIKLRIEILYRSKGYTHVGVTIAPKQKEGTLLFQIKEGKKKS